ncbi:MAG: ABC transporter permease [Armatimonadota bacterium]|nr:ABC transporter permease [Armatimonadota bacterium]
MRQLWRELKHRKLGMAGALVLLLIAAAAVAAPVLATTSPTRLSIQQRLSPPSGTHYFGTDHLGRDVFSRILHGGRTSLWVGGLVAIASAASGLVLGLTAGYFPRLDAALMRVMDGMMAFPAILLALAIVAATGPSAVNVVLALTLVYTPRIARVARAAVLTVRHLEYVQAIEALGGHPTRILARHIFPNTLAPVLVQVSITFAYAILAEAGLSFLGVGPSPVEPTWGNILAEGRQYLHNAPWITLFPGVAISLTVLGINLMGDALRDALDPRLRGGN